jgi:hypothetical protein
MCLLVTCLATVGCGEGSLAASSTPKETPSSADDIAIPAATSRTIDAGIVLADRAGYFCLPLEQIGLPPDAEIVSLQSSCECVRPRLVQYVQDRQRIGQAILLEYVPEVSAADTSLLDSPREFEAVHLSVIVEVVLSDGVKHDFVLNLLHTLLERN